MYPSPCECADLSLTNNLGLGLRVDFEVTFCVRRYIISYLSIAEK